MGPKLQWGDASLQNSQGLFSDRNQWNLMRDNKSWKKEEKIHHVGRDAWGLTHKSCKALHCVVWDSSVLPQTYSANLDLTLNNIFLTWDSQPLLEVLRYSAAMMNITEKLVFHRYQLQLPLVFYKQTVGPFLSTWIWTSTRSPRLSELMLCLQSTKSFEQASTSVQHGTKTIMQISELS